MSRYVAPLLPLFALWLTACPTESAPKPESIEIVPAPTPRPPPPAPEPLAPPTVPAGAAVKIVSPKDGETVTSPVKLVMEATGIEVKPAGEVTLGTGHHHLIVDGGPIALGTAVPKDATHLHFGKGQTEAEVPLEPGPHTLTIQFADGAHMSYGEALSQTIHITVK